MPTNIIIKTRMRSQKTITHWLSLCALMVASLGVTHKAYSQCTQYSVGGGGSICSGSSTTVTLSGFDAFTEYALYRDGTLVNQVLPTVGLSWTVSQSGTYTVKAINETCNELAMVGSAVVIVITNPQLTLSSTPATEACAGQTVSFQATGSTTYDWLVNGSEVTDDDHDSVFELTNPAAGSYTIRVVGLVCAQNPYTEHTIVVKPQVQGNFSPSGPSILCKDAPNSTFTVTLSEITGAVSVSSWTISPGTAGTIIGSGATVQVDWNGSYSGTVSVSASVAGCGNSSITGTRQVSVLAPRTTTLSGNDETCSNQPFVLTVNEPDLSTSVVYTIFKDGNEAHEFTHPVSTYNWNATGNGVYTLQASTKTCPADTIVGSVTVNQGGGSILGIITSPASGPFCEGTQIGFEASGGSNYHWYVDENEVVNGFPDLGQVPGTYTVRVDGINSCGIQHTQTSTIIVTDDVNVPPVIAGPALSCNLQSSYTVTADAPATYTWTITPTSAAISTTPSANALVVKWQAGFTGLVEVKVTAQGCSNSFDKMFQTTLAQQSQLSILSLDTVVCANTPLTFNASGGSSYQWTKLESGFTTYGNSPSMTFSEATTLRLSGLDSTCNLPTSTTITIEVDPRSVGGLALSSDNSKKYNVVNGPTYPVSILQGHVGNVVGWQYRANSVIWTDLASSATETAPSTPPLGGPGSFITLRAIVQSGVCPSVYSDEVTYSWADETNLNYIKVYTPQVPMSSYAEVQTNLGDPSKVVLVSSYFDGATREIQKVSRGLSPGGGDLVLPKEYDAGGNESKVYLPYSNGSGVGTFTFGATAAQLEFYSNPPPGVTGDSSPFSISVIEPSPLRRVVEQGAPGVTWQPNAGHAVGLEYRANAQGEVLRFRLSTAGKISILPGEDSFYTENTLTCTVTKDEDGHEVQEFKNFDGMVLCKKVQAPNGIFAQTYYIYDDLGNLTLVIQPEGVQEILNHLN